MEVSGQLNALIVLPPVGGRQSQSGCFGGTKHLILPESEPQVIQPLAQSQYWAMLFHIPHI